MCFWFFLIFINILSIIINILLIFNDKFDFFFLNILCVCVYFAIMWSNYNLHWELYHNQLMILAIWFLLHQPLYNYNLNENYIIIC